MAGNTDIFSRNPRYAPGIFYALFFLSFVSAVAQPRLALESDKHSFGSVARGTVITETYRFTNKGNAPLIISAAEVECSCTQVTYPKHPVAPGAKDSIVVVFDTKTVYGRQDREVSISSNDPNEISLRFKGTVSRH